MLISHLCIILYISPILYARHCEFISAFTQPQALKFSDCTTTNAVHIQDSELFRLSFLDNLLEIHFKPELAAGDCEQILYTGAAVYIVNNECLDFKMAKNFLPNLKKIIFTGLEEKQERAFIIRDNSGCVIEEAADRLRKIGGGPNRSNIETCHCSIEELHLGVPCTFVKGNVVINETTYIKHKFITGLKNVQEIHGYLKIDGTKLEKVDFLDKLNTIENEDPEQPSLSITNNEYLKSFELPFLLDQKMGVVMNRTISGLCRPVLLIMNNTNLAGVDTEGISLEIKETDQHINTTEINGKCNSIYADEAMISTNECFLPSEFYLTKTSQEELRYCKTVITEDFIINHNTVDIEPKIMKKINRLQGCLTIENSTLVSLAFLNFETIHGCKRDEMIRINNNSKLEELRYSFAFCTFNESSTEHEYISITNNKNLCQKEVKAAVQQSKLACSIRYSHHTNKEGRCREEVSNLALEPLWSYLGLTFGFTIVAAGIPFAVKVLLQQDFQDFWIFQKLYRMWHYKKYRDYQEVDTTEKTVEANTPTLTASTTSMPLS